MKVGYTILGLTSQTQRKEFERFLKDNFILEEGYVTNITEVVVNGDPINLYTQVDLKKYLTGQSSYDFSVEYSEINVPDDVVLVASAVDFRIEIQFNGGIKVLTPTEYFTTTEELAKTLIKEVKQGLLKVYPELPQQEGTFWILDNGYWNDEGVWEDEKNWKD